MRKPHLAKLAIPAMPGAIERPRLFAALDEMLTQPAAWICGPPGSGKTTLVSSYLSARAGAVAWFQMDSGDADPSSFFYYMRLAAPRSRGRLPLLTVEYQSDLLPFARRFFREFYAPPLRVLVLDGFHELPEHCALRNVLCEAAFELPRAVRLIVISRAGPPPALARRRAQGTLTVLDWDSMRLTREEVGAIARAERIVDDDAIRHLYERSDGWAAGLRLLLQNATPRSPHAFREAICEHSTLFDYFASEVFNQAPSELQRFLLSTAVLPDIQPSIAQALTGYGEAVRMLEAMHTRHLFTERLGDVDRAYRYHPLFGEFLLHRARTLLGAVGFRNLQGRAGVLLADQGRLEASIPLCLAAGEWLAAARAILEVAPRLIEHGRFLTVRRWILALPRFLLDGSSRLMYALGTAQIPLDPGGARHVLLRAWNAFAAQADLAGQALTAAAIIETYYFQYDSYIGVERWIESIKELLAAGAAFATAEEGSRVYALLLIAISYRQPSDPFLPLCAEHLRGMLAGRIDVNQRLMAASLLLNYCDWFASDRAQEVLAWGQPYLRSAEVSPFNRLRWWLAELHHWRFQGDDGRTYEAVARMREEAENSGVRSFDLAMQIVNVWAAQPGASAIAEEGLVETLASMVHGQRRQEELLFRVVLAEARLRRGDAAGALEQAQPGLALALETGHVGQSLTACFILATALAWLGRAGEARSYLARARAQVPEGVDKIAFSLLLIEAFVHLRAGDEACAAVIVGEAFALGRLHGYLSSFLWVPQMMSELLVLCLRRRIEVEYARRLIRARNLNPGSAQADDWPWKIRIVAFGPFTVFVDGVPLTFQGKAPKRPLELLKGLVARGGERVDAQSLWESLWPDAEGDAAANAFAMALHRLRKLLGAETLLLEEGKLSLNGEQCWLDTRAFERACEGDERDPAILSRAIALYRGPFLESEPLHPWMLPARDRFRSKMLRTIQALARLQGHAGRWQEAADACRAAIEVESLSEPLYQELMRCLIELGQHGEAQDVYRCCRQMLAVEFGAVPSPQTEALLTRSRTTI